MSDPFGFAPLDRRGCAAAWRRCSRCRNVSAPRSLPSLVGSAF